jgi:hypothetical protein
VSVKFEMAGFRAAAAALVSSIRKDTYESLKIALAEAENDAKKSPWYKDGPGLDKRYGGIHLRQAIHGTMISSTRGELKADRPYALFIEAGQKEHIIPGRRGGAVSFVWNGVPVAFRWVRHKAQDAAPFMAHASDWGEMALYSELNSAVNSSINRFNA